MKTYKPK